MAMHELILNRRSARGYDARASISDNEVVEILDAGRWAPTWGGTQPVRFVVGIKDREGALGTTFEHLVSLLTRGNQSWAPAASALIMLDTEITDSDNDPTPYGTVDLGLALAQMILQANALGFNAHPLAGFNAIDAIEKFVIPSHRRPFVIVAIGKLANAEDVPPDIAARDGKPRKRKALKEVAFSGKWGSPLPIDVTVDN